jgi:hypothetical protein
MRRSARLERRAAVVDRRHARLAWARLALAVLAVASLLAGWRLVALRDVAIAASALAALPLGVVIAVHARVARHLRRLRCVHEAARREELRLLGRWRSLPRTGEGLAGDARERDLAEDLGVLGRASLFQLVARCATPRGEQVLARWLLHGAPAPDLEARQEAVRELAPRVAWRQRLEAEGRLAGEDAPWLDAAMVSGSGPSWHASRPWAAPILGALGAITVAQGLVGAALDVPTAFWPCAIVLGTVATLLSRRLHAEYAALLSCERSLMAWARMLERVERARLRCPLLVSLRARVGAPASGAGASAACRELAAILGALSLRENILFWPINVLTGWEAWHSARLWRWRHRHAASWDSWAQALGDLEALASLAGHCRLLEESAFLELRAGDALLDFEGMRHPLISPDRAVPNDVVLGAGRRLLLLTGSNMSGKSTLLRTVGLNALLALAGGPASARRLQAGACRVRTSIHVTDALDEGVSLFYAEVRRLAGIVAEVDGAERDLSQPCVLFLIDEILRGTNTRDRHVASRSIIARLARTRSLGIVTSHDLALTQLEHDVRGVVNAHFREEVVDGRMTFDYVLRPGPVTTSNALLILKLEGLDVDPTA